MYKKNTPLSRKLYAKRKQQNKKKKSFLQIKNKRKIENLLTKK